MEDPYYVDHDKLSAKSVIVFEYSSPYEIYEPISLCSFHNRFDLMWIEQMYIMGIQVEVERQIVISWSSGSRSV